MSIERAEADLERARDHVALLRTRLDDAERAVAKLETYLEVARGYEAPPDQGASVSQGKGRPKRGELSLADVCAEIIKETGKRQTTRSLLATLEARGIQISGNDKLASLSGALCRSRILVANRSEGWGVNAAALTSDHQNGLAVERVQPAEIPY